MKKTLLLTAVALCATSVMAGVVTRAQSDVKTAAPVDGSMYMPLAEEQLDVMATPGTTPKKVATKAGDGSPKAFYKRPAGAFYGLCSSQENNNYKYSSQYAPYLMGWPFQTVKYVPNTINVGEVSSYDWTYFLYNRDTKLHEEYAASGPELDVYYGVMTLDTVPRLTVTGSEGTYDYTIKGWSVTGTGTNKVINKEYRSRYIARVDYQTTFTNTADQSMWCTPKFRAASTNRDATKLAGGTYSSGAKDAEGGTTGKWFGRNYSGIDALGMAFEKPSHPYLLRRVGVAFQNLAFSSTDPCDLKVKVYKLDEMPQYKESESVFAEPGELLAEGTFTMVPEEFTSAGITSGMLPFALEAPDDGSGLIFDVEPEIDFPILVVFTGYNNSTIADFTLTQGTDLYDEGFGEHCYMGRTQSDGSIKYQGLNYFFTSGERKAGISIYAEVAHPFMIPNFNVDVLERTFDAAGVCQNQGFRTSDGKVYEGNEMSIYSHSPSEEVEISLEDGSELPEWLTVTVEDEMEGEVWDGLLKGKFEVTPLPEGVKGRKANVKLAIPGARMVVAVVQGEADDPGVKGDVNGDGVVDIADVNAAIDMVLGLADNKPTADVNGDGVVDIADINAIIDIVLGL